MRIIADTATLLSPAEGASLGIQVVPVCVLINDQSYKDYSEITTSEFLRMVAEGGIPKSSQPSLGDVLDVLNGEDKEIIFITVGDGLSGAYQTAMAARSCIEDNGSIHIVNSKTLAGAMRHLAKKAAMLKAQGMSAGQILADLEEGIESSVSFVIPEDFDFLKRSGRLTPIAAKIGGALRLLPVLTQTKDKTRIAPVSVKRTWRTAIETIMQRLESHEIGEGWLISVCHAGTPDKAEGVRQKLLDRFPDCETEVLELSPALTTHGGPGCIVVQAIKK